MKTYLPKIKLKNCKEIREFAGQKGKAKKFVVPYRTGFAVVSEGKIEKYLTGMSFKKINCK
jgi:hypothetical protein